VYGRSVMRGEIVFYLQLEESRRLLNQLDFLLRRTYGDISKGRMQMVSQVPGVVDFLLQLAQFMPTTIDIASYLPKDGR